MDGTLIRRQLCAKPSHALLIGVDDLRWLPLPVRVPAFDLVTLRHELGEPGGTLGFARVGVCLLGAHCLALLGLLYLLVPRNVGDVLDLVSKALVSRSVSTKTGSVRINAISGFSDGPASNGCTGASLS